MKRLWNIVVTAFIAGYAPLVFAADSPYSYDKLMQAVNNLVDFLLRMAGVAVVGVLTWYGLKMVLARGDPGKFTEAKKGLTWAIIGAVVIFGVFTIIATIRYAVGALGGK